MMFLQATFVVKRRLSIAIFCIGAFSQAWLFLMASDSNSNTWTDPVTGMLFVRIEAGGFVMGSPPEEAGREAQKIRHEVLIVRPFWLGAFEVTQEEWEKVMGNNPSHFQMPGGRLPVERVN